MRHRLAIVTFLFVALLGSCVEKDCCLLEEQGGNNLNGTWSLFERGYSPGSGYIVETVDPGQTITFGSGGAVTSNIQGLSDFRFYSFQNNVLAFFKTNPGPSPDPATFLHSYGVNFDDVTLKLTYRWCIEGCHLSLRRSD